MATAHSSRRFPCLWLALPALALALVAAGLLASLPMPWAGIAGVLVWWPSLALLALSAWNVAEAARGRSHAFPVARWLAAHGLIAGHGLIVLALLVPALAWLRGQPSLAGSLVLAGCLSLCVLLPWRWWSALVMPWLDHGEQMEGLAAAGLRVRRSLRAAAHLGEHERLSPWLGVSVLIWHGALVSWPVLIGLLPWPPTVGPWLVLAVLGFALAAWLGYAGLMPRLRAILDGVREQRSDAAEAEPDAEPVLESETIPELPLLRDTALREALRGGRIERALALLEARADPTAGALPDEPDRRNALAIAATLNDSRPLRAMIAMGIDVEHRCQGLTPLLVATRDSYYGRAEIVLALLANGADLKVRDSTGRTPLHHAALSVEPAVAAMLLDAGAAVDVVDEEGCTPLVRAAAAGNLPLVRLLLDRRAAVSVPGAVPALCASAAGADDSVDVIQRLLKARAEVNGRDADGRTALHHAALAGHAGITRVLLDAGAAIDARDGDSRTALEALHASDPASPVVQVLRAAGAKFMPAQAAQTDATAPVNLDSSLTPAMTIAIKTDPVELLALSRRGALHAWLRTAPAVARADLAREAVTQGARQALLAILSRPFPADVRLGNGTPLIEAALDTWPASHELLERLPSCGIAVSGGAWLARLLAAPGGQAEWRESIALAWLDAGADPFAADPNGIDPLQHAVAQGQERLTTRLLDLGVHVQHRDFAGFTPLHRALDHDDAKALRLASLLLRHGADPQALASSGETPLGLAMHGDRVELVNWLRWPNWSLPRRKLAAHDVVAAVQVGDLVALRRLLSMGLDCAGRDAQGGTALIHAAGGGYLELIDELLTHGADLHATSTSGVDALLAAIIAGHEQVVVRLLERGANARKSEQRRSQPLVVAAACGMVSMVDRLLRAGAAPGDRDASGNTALHAAAGFAFASEEASRVRALLMQLLAAGADPESCNGTGLTPLHIVCGAVAAARAGPLGIDAALDVLLTRIRNVDLPDQNGCTPLHYAAAHGQVSAVRRLLGRGADRGRRDHGNWCAEDYAGKYGFTDVVRELRQPPS